MENWSALCAYVERWEILKNTAARWPLLKAQRRQEITADLYDRLVVPCRLQTKLHEVIHQHRLPRAVFIYMAAEQGLRSSNPIQKVAAVYLTLYYSKVDGAFVIPCFAPQYREANRF